jgi:hypothetical protein
MQWKTKLHLRQNAIYQVATTWKHLILLSKSVRNVVSHIARGISFLITLSNLRRECQVQHWKEGHKSECAGLATTQTNRLEVVKTILTDLLFYISPCVVSNFLRKGRGILFAFTEQPLQQYIDVQMQKPGNYDRQLILQYFTEQEIIDVFLNRVGIINSSTQNLMSKYQFQLNFGLLLRLPPGLLDVMVKNVIPSLLGLVKAYNPKTHFHFIFATGCGYVTSLQTSLFPDFDKCKKQASKFDDMDVVVLNLDRS